MNRVRCLLSRTFVVSFLVLLFAAIAGAQENAAITGTVTDQSGATVPNATVVVTHVATGISHSTVSGGDGLFNFSALQIGVYDLKVTAQGFATYTQQGLVLNEAQTLRADAKLQVGSASQTVTVQANVLQVQSETSEVSSLISGQQVLQLATNGRNVMSLTTLGTGVTNTLPSFNGVTAQGSSAEINFNGSRYDHNNWMIDGGEIYDRGSGGKLGVAVSPDALGEFQVLSSNYMPDYGIASGGTVAMVLKSGTRSFHGGLWEFNRNDAFDAGYYFFKQHDQPTPELRLNIFGGNVGGPVWIPHVYNNDRNKTFFFVNEEWRKFIQGANPSVTNTIPAAFFPTAGQPLAYTPLSGNPLIVPATNDPAKLAQYSQDGLVAGQPFTQSAPGVYTIPANLIDPNAVLFMGTGAIPKPNTANGTQYIASPKQPTYVREDVVRIDHHFNDKYTLMGHWIHDQMSQTIFPDMWSNNSYVTTGDVFANPSWGTVVKLTQTLSPTLLNETGIFVNGNTIDITPAGIYAQPSGWSQTGFFNPASNALNRMPSIDFSGAPNTNWTINYWPWHNSYLNYQPRDDVSWSKGEHQFKFGFAYMRSDKNQQQQADTQGDYTFNQSSYSQDAYANFLLGFASSFTQLQSLATAHWVNNTYSMYGNDNWHVLPRLTLNLGLRWDILPHVYEKNNRTSNFIPADFNPADAQVPNAAGQLDPTGPGFSQPAGAPVPFYLNGVKLAGVNGFPRGLVKNDYGTWQPRVGFAYDISGNGKTVFRGGFGMFFERVQGNDIYGTDTNPPFAYQPSVSAVYFSNPSTNNQTGQTASAPFFPGNFQNLSYTYPNPATSQFSLGVQREVAPSMVAAIQYVGMTAYHQNVQRAINTLPLGDVTDRQAVATKGANANLYRNFSGFSNVTQIENTTNSNYNSLQAALRMDSRHGLTFQFSYTYSHEIDIQSGDLTSTNQQGSGGDLSDPFNTNYDRGSGTIDRRNVFTANYVYNFPFFLHSSSALKRSLLGGWQISGITVAQSGNPVNATYTPDTLGLGGGTTNRPNKVQNVSYPHKQLAWFNTGTFGAPVAPWNGGGGQGFGSAGKDTIVGPGLFNWNMSLFKSFQLPKEGMQIQLRAESYNTFNHTEWNNIDTQFTDHNFGQITSTYDPRTWQFGGKFLF